MVTGTWRRMVTSAWRSWSMVAGAWRRMVAGAWSLENGRWCTEELELVASSWRSWSIVASAWRTWSWMDALAGWIR